MTPIGIADYEVRELFDRARRSAAEIGHLLARSSELVQQSRELIQRIEAAAPRNGTPLHGADRARAMATPAAR